MGHHWIYLIVLLWFSYLTISSILIFKWGFFLTRNFYSNRSSCIQLSRMACQDDSTTNKNYQSCNDELLDVITNSIYSDENYCLPSNTKVLLIIIDALRYDFTLYNDSIKSPLPYQNGLPIISTLMKQYPEQTRLYKFLADPPTTTYQRLKGLTVGNLPTFIEVGLNYASTEIQEDNIVDQVVRNGKKAVFLGDDTWKGLYPGRFIRNYPFPSFNVWDLDTVDYGINSKLTTEVESNDWNLIIAHFLGVDHCGHLHGPNHPEMIRKLSEMNTVIKNMSEIIDNDTMLMVIGDHGMTYTGDHGGDTENEMISAFFLYSKVPLMKQTHSTQSIRQIDIIPTLAHILGVPIPFSNLGTTVLDVLPVFSNIDYWKIQVFYLWRNTQQIVSYIHQYYSDSADNSSNSYISDILKRFNTIHTWITKLDYKEDIAEAHIVQMQKLMRDVLKLCEKSWVQFDAILMARGLISMFLTICLIFIIVDGISYHNLGLIFNFKFLLVSTTTILGVLSIMYSISYLDLYQFNLSDLLFGTTFTSHLILILQIIHNWYTIALTWFKRYTIKILYFLSRIIFLFTIIGVFANSFIIEEQTVLLLCLTSLTILSMLELFSLKNVNNRIKYKIILLVIIILFVLRVTAIFWRCREEHVWCRDEKLSFYKQSSSSKFQWFLSVVLLAVLVTVVKTWLKNCGNLNGYAPTITTALYVPTLIVVCSGAYWALNRLPLQSKRNFLSLQQINGLAIIVYFSSIGAILITIFKPLCINVITRSASSHNVVAQHNVIPQIFQKVKRLFHTNNNSSYGDGVPIVCGLATVYSAAFILIGTYVMHLMALLLTEINAISIVICTVVMMMVLFLNGYYRLEVSKKSDELFDVSYVSIWMWSILAQYFFYGFGHQPVFANIPFETAFIGTASLTENNYILGCLILLRLFASYLLMSLLLPLVLIIPFTLSVMLPPTWISNKSILQIDGSLKGEIAIYEKNDLVYSVLFSICSKYIVINGIKVFTSMLATTIHSRHLMTWNIFAPKLLFEFVSMLVTLFGVTFGYCVFVRIHKSVQYFFDRLNSTSKSN